MKAMVLAAGLGTRLRPLTDSIPKPLLPLGSYPLLVWNLLLLRKYGVTDIVINLHHRGDQIRQAIGSGAQYGLQVAYSPEPVLLGTGGGIKQAEAHFQGEPFLVLNGDTIVDLDLADMIACHFRNQAIATMALRDDQDVDHWGAIELNDHDHVLRINGKGTTKGGSRRVASRRMFAGVHVLDPLLLRDVPPGVFSSIIDAYEAWLERDAIVAGYVFSGYWTDVGTPERYEQVQQDLAAGHLHSPSLAP